MIGLVDGSYWIADPMGADDGEYQIELARLDMPGLVELVRHYGELKPLSGARIAVSVIPTPETGNLVWTLRKLGASVRLCSDNRVSTNDEVAAALVRWGIPVFAKRDQTKEEYFQCFREVVKFKDEKGNIVQPHQIVDDGFDLSQLMHEERPELIENLRGVTEQTTCGVNFAHKLMIAGQLRCSVIDINSGVKAAFDNRYGPRESFLDSFFECFNLELGGKVVILAGYGPVGKACADLLRAVGSRVVVAEADPIRGAQALMEGFQVDSLENASRYGDIFIVTTGSPRVIREEHFLLMKDGAVLCNMGENYLEYDTNYLNDKRQVLTIRKDDNLSVHVLPNRKKLFALASGGLLNMRGGGHPPRLLSITFCLHVLMQIALAQNNDQFQKGIIYKTPRKLQEHVILMCFPELNGKIEVLSDEQLAYMGRTRENPFEFNLQELVYEFIP